MEQEKYTKFEIARMLGSRALQIASGAPFMLKINEKQLEEMHFNPITIAKMELEKNALPLTVKRPLPREVQKRTAA
ncbi:DNA-directed RNA polymerase subunit K [Candidatus Woesearchaeota archaeon]|nr:DNA-directed RNA polymerase subunit K [Candidatus Woesearchaeota archaeon]MBW2978693.1 DNA-directed RNA polymerase subunit K [Candidatus Woesearchaeota archaeon]